MAPLPRAGHLQTLTHHPDGTITIVDTLYGAHHIPEPVLLALLTSDPLVRLSGVNQHGITGLLGLTPPITCLEHSIGAFLLVRMAGAALDEQVAALLHDVSHTVLSHVVDFASLSCSGKSDESFHEVHKARYIAGTELVSVLKEHGFGEEVFREERYPLVEQPAPRLCADRLDYALRDVVGFEKLRLQETREIIRGLSVYPAVESSERVFVLRDEELALKLARAYQLVDRDVWSNPRNIGMYVRAGGVIGDAVRRGQVDEGLLWRVSDEEFWEVLRVVMDEAGRDVMRALEEECQSETEEGTVERKLPKETKIRTIDPDVWLSSPGSGSGSGGARGESECKPLSEWNPAWAVERAEYIQTRRKRMQ